MSIFKRIYISNIYFTLLKRIILRLFARKKYYPIVPIMQRILSDKIYFLPVKF
jgi:hypothetical protein